MYGYIIFIISVAIALVCISYNSIACAHNWSIGEILSKDALVPKIAAMITALWALGKSFMLLEWWSPAVVLITGWILAFVLTMTLKKNVQFVGIVGIFPAMFLTILYLSESQPLGMLHDIFS